MHVSVVIAGTLILIIGIVLTRIMLDRRRIHKILKANSEKEFLDHFEELKKPLDEEPDEIQENRSHTPLSTIELLHLASTPFPLRV